MSPPPPSLTELVRAAAGRTRSLSRSPPPRVWQLAVSAPPFVVPPPSVASPLELVSCAACGAPLDADNDRCLFCDTMPRASRARGRAHATLEHLEDASVDRAYVEHADRALRTAPRAGFAMVLAMIASYGLGLVAAAWALAHGEVRLAVWVFGISVSLTYGGATLADELLPGRYWKPRPGPASSLEGRCQGCGAPARFEVDHPRCGCCGAGLFPSWRGRDTAQEMAREAALTADEQEWRLTTSPFGPLRIAQLGALVASVLFGILWVPCALAAAFARLP